MTFDHVTIALRDCLLPLPRVLALFLSGSKGEDLADDVSDTDLVLVVDADSVDAVSASLEALEVPALGAIIHRDVLRFPGTLVFNFIGENYDRFDVAVETPEQFGRRTAHGLKAVHDPSDLAGGLAHTAPTPPVAYGRLLSMSTECLRILGLLSVGFARQDWVVMCGGAGMMRTLVSTMLLELTATGPRGGMMSYRRALPADIYRLLEELPPIVADRDAIVAVHEALARVLLEQIKPRLIDAGQTWPQPFEDAVRKVLSTSGVRI